MPRGDPSNCPLLRLVCALVLLGGWLAAGSLAAAGLRGLPFARSYSLEDIGYVPRGARLNFDSFGRIAVIHDGVYAVLNDSAWLNVADAEESARLPMSDVVHAGYGQTYYAGRASWGLAEFGVDGKIRARPLVPRNPPAWTRTTTFDELIVTAEGVYFASRTGVVFWDFSRKESQIFELDRVSKIFAVGNKVFISSFGHGLRCVDVAAGRIAPAPGTPLDRMVVDRAIALDATHALVSALNGELFVFDGSTLTPWRGRGYDEIRGRISVLQRLPDGDVAVAMTGKGLFVFSRDGELMSALTTPQYHRISSIASRESGVLWVLTEESIEKVLYSGGLTSFGQRLGLTVWYPQVAARDGRVFIASAGVLYEAQPGAAGGPARVVRAPHQPAGGAILLAGGGSHLLTSDRSRIYAVQRDGTLEAIASIRDVTNLAMVGENQCYAIGPSEIALFEWDGQRWHEPVPRVPGLAHAFNVQRSAKAVWVEMGGDGVARISRKDGKLDVWTLKNESWTQALWVNISIVGDIAMLSTLKDQRRFFDERTETWCEMPEFARMLDRSPRWIARVWMDETGVLWATHSEGLVRFSPNGDGYDVDRSSYDFINDRYPMVHVLPGNDIWISASRSLHHVEQSGEPRTNSPPKPVLVSLMDTRRNVDLLARRLPTDARLQLPFSQNSLMVHLFSGSYAWRRTPVYEFRLKPSEPWATLDTGSLLRLPALREGSYELGVRIAGDGADQGPPLLFAFEILPPWPRTLPAYALYATLAVLAVTGIIYWSGRLAHRRNRALEGIVRERTSDLESAMQKLNEETRITATLAERDRLAGEIHDSVQQGLSGAILQLDSTVRLPSLNADVLGRLQVIRNMVAYARQEVQHVVWDMDSPLLEHNDLGEALRKLATFTMSSTLTPTVQVSGPPVQLPRTLTHHLLRIAQEATTNAVRHARAQRVEISLEYQPAAVVLRVADDGIGFNPDDVLTRHGHFGLRGIRGRARKIRAEVAFTSSPGGGTTVCVVAPVA